MKSSLLISVVLLFGLWCTPRTIVPIYCGDVQYVPVCQQRTVRYIPYSTYADLKYDRYSMTWVPTWQCTRHSVPARKCYRGHRQ